MREGVGEVLWALAEDVRAARRRAAVAQAQLAMACVAYADSRTAADRQVGVEVRGRGRARLGEFVADELSVLLREQPYAVRRLVCRSRRLAIGLATVWQAYGVGDLDAEQVWVIDRVARRVSEAGTLAAIDDAAVVAAQTRGPKQLAVWLLRLVVQLEPLAFEARHRRALAERRVTVVQGADGMGYVTGEVSAADAAAVDATLAAAARSLGADDPRTDQQRRADVFADLLLGRLGFAEPADAEGIGGADGLVDLDDPVNADGDETTTGWLEIEDVDPETGEWFGFRWQQVDGDGEVVGEPVASPLPRARAGGGARGLLSRPVRPPLRIGVVVPLSSLRLSTVAS